MICVCVVAVRFYERILAVLCVFYFTTVTVRSRSALRDVGFQLHVEPYSDI